MVLSFFKDQKETRFMTSASLHTEAGIIGLLDLHREFKTNLGSLVRPCVTIQNNECGL